MLGALALIALVAAVPAAQARVPRLTYGEALSASEDGARDAYLDNWWAEDYYGGDCLRQSRTRFACVAEITGSIDFDCGYTSCWSVVKDCQVPVRVRSGYWVNYYTYWIGYCTTYPDYSY
jgi:hypothetical protein